MRFTLLLATIAVVFLSGCTKQKAPAEPVLASEWWLIAPAPDLTELGLQPEPGERQSNQPNDHHIFQTDDGRWHLWACVRETRVGRILAHWQADSLTASPWTFTGEIIRASREAGESLVDWKGQEFIQSPYVVKHQDQYYMFYGGYDSGLDADGDSTGLNPDYDTVEKQISLMRSDDGYNWRRHQNADGYSRVFIGPGAARDPCIRRFGDRWYGYYCGHHNRDRTCGAIYVRTSADLVQWSDWKIAHYDKSHEGDSWLPESPHVVEHDGFYYLFRTHSDSGGTVVFRSDDPLNFGHGDVRDRAVAWIDVIAPEIFSDNSGNQYISKIYDPRRGWSIWLARLDWNENQR